MLASQIAAFQVCCITRRRKTRGGNDTSGARRSPFWLQRHFDESDTIVKIKFRFGKEFIEACTVVRGPGVGGGGALQPHLAISTSPLPQSALIQFIHTGMKGTELGQSVTGGDFTILNIRLPFPLKRGTDSEREGRRENGEQLRRHPLQ